MEDSIGKASSGPGQFETAGGVVSRSGPSASSAVVIADDPHDRSVDGASFFDRSWGASYLAMRVFSSPSSLMAPCEKNLRTM